MLAFGLAERLVKDRFEGGTMRRLMKLGAALTTLAIGALIASSVGAGAQESPAPADEKVTFTVGMVNDAITFNPMFMIETPEYSTADLVYETFLSWDEDFNTAPGLATDWEQSEDGLTWTFQVRDDVTWQDGEPLTASDIAATFNWIIDEGVGNYIDYLPFTDEITAPDDDDPCLEDHHPDQRADLPPVHLHPARARPQPVRGQGRLPGVEGVPGRRSGRDRSSSSSGAEATSGASRRTPTTGAAPRRSTSSFSGSSRTRSR